MWRGMEDTWSDRAERELARTTEEILEAGKTELESGRPVSIRNYEILCLSFFNLSGAQFSDQQNWHWPLRFISALVDYDPLSLSDYNKK